jgi:hypothetical protein
LREGLNDNALSDSLGLEEEGGEFWDAKQTRMLVDGDGSDDPDPLDIVGLDPLPMHPRVHFAAPEIIQPMPRLGAFKLLPQTVTPPPVDEETDMVVDGAPAPASAF